MTPSAGLPGPNQDPAWSLDLEFPDGDPFYSEPPTLSFADWLEWNEKMRSWFPEAIPTEAERLRTKVDVEFVL